MSEFYDASKSSEEMEELIDAYVPKVHFELLPISSLVSNQEYQRNISAQHIKKVAKEFDIYQVNPVKVSKRDGKNYVFDGQHTIEIIALASGSRDIPVWCMIYDDLIYTEEADIFANQMKYKKGLKPMEIFKANIEAGNQTQLMIKEVVESYGLKISEKNAALTITCVSALEWIYERYGFEGLDHALLLTVGAWEGSNGSLCSGVLKGIAIISDVYKGKIDDEVFMDRVGRMSIKELMRIAKDRRGGALGYAEAMLLEYNKRTKSKLSLGYLYGYSGKKKKNLYNIESMLDEYEETANEIASNYSDPEDDDFDYEDDEY